MSRKGGHDTILPPHGGATIIRHSDHQKATPGQMFSIIVCLSLVHFNKRKGNKNPNT